ncbi:hypothetical protein BGZ93_005015 [Podila epicladia]|nr:hypothetical protein BGZ93_005015 [Podila epicladia]
MSQGSCVNYCKTNQYQYAITEGGTLCFCANQSPPEKNRVEDTYCNKPCAGYPFEMCGSETTRASGVAGSAYANVMLVGNSLEQPSTTIPGKDLPKPSDVPVVASLNTEVRQDHEQGSTEEAPRKRNEEDEDEDESEDEDEDEDESDENDDEEDTKGVNGIPVASTAVAVVCLLGIVSFLVYLGRKRKRARVRAAWVDSVFGTTGGSDNNDNNANSRSSFRRYDDQDSFSYDGQSEIIERRMSTLGPIRGREDSFSRSVRSSVLKPAPVLSSMFTSSPNYHQTTYHHRLHPVSPMHEHYAEFFDEDDCEDAELTYLEEYLPDASPTSTSSEFPMLRRPSSALLETGSASHHGQRYPAGHPFSVNHHPYQLQRSQDSCNSSGDPFQDHTPARLNSYLPEGDRHARQDLHPYLPNRILHRHSQPEISMRRPPSNYRRPHSFTGNDHDEDTRHRTYVLNESDTESVRAPTLNENDAKSDPVQHFKRISIPYVQSIRQQQIESLSEGNEGGWFVQDPNTQLEQSLPAPGPAPTERRWSRVLKSVGREFGQRRGSSTERPREGCDGRTQGGRPSHRQVHSGSLASFSGLGDPSHPRLRVTNPDGESC